MNVGWGAKIRAVWQVYVAGCLFISERKKKGQARRSVLVARGLSSELKVLKVLKVVHTVLLVMRTYGVTFSKLQSDHTSRCGVNTVFPGVCPAKNRGDAFRRRPSAKKKRRDPAEDAPPSERLILIIVLFLRRGASHLRARCARCEINPSTRARRALLRPSVLTCSEYMYTSETQHTDNEWLG